MSRQVVLDTETTGLEASAGHRIIEIGCVELVNRRPTRRTFHRYLNPDRAVDAGALEVHGIDDEFLAEQPRFVDVVDEFLDFVRGAELVIHNADFDVEFLDHELRRLSSRPGNGAAAQIRDACQVLDTLALARRMHPGQRNSLDALAKRYSVDNSKRELHGALLDAQILADVYLAMTGGQVSLSLDGQSEREAADVASPARVAREGLLLPVLTASPDEQAAHAGFLARIGKKSGRPTLWERVFAKLEQAPAVAAPLDVEAAAAPGSMIATAGYAGDRHAFGTVEEHAAAPGTADEHTGARGTTGEHAATRGGVDQGAGLAAAGEEYAGAAPRLAAAPA